MSLVVVGVVFGRVSPLLAGFWVQKKKAGYAFLAVVDNAKGRCSRYLTNVMSPSYHMRVIFETSVEEFLVEHVSMTTSMV